MKTGKELAFEAIKLLIEDQIERFGIEHTHRNGMVLKTRPDDSNSIIYVKDTSEESLNLVYNRISEKYRDHVIGFEPVFYHYYGPHKPAMFGNYQLKFDEEFQKMFYEALESYCNAKQAWCDKYGCD